jgi:glc operon protein GlcG
MIFGGSAMRTFLKSAKFASVLAVALLSNTAVFAQVPADPANPNEALPEVMNSVPYGETINIDMAKKVAAAAIAEAKKRNWNGLCLAIVSPSGDLVYFEKQDLCQYGSVNVSIHKARASARYRRPTLVFERLIGKGQFYNYLATLDDVIASRGGNPILGRSASAAAPAPRTTSSR